MKKFKHIGHMIEMAISFKKIEEDFLKRYDSLIPTLELHVKTKRGKISKSKRLCKQLKKSRIQTTTSIKELEQEILGYKQQIAISLKGEL